MANIVIKDLEEGKELDQQAMAKVTGGRWVRRRYTRRYVRYYRRRIRYTRTYRRTYYRTVRYRRTYYRTYYRWVWA